MHPTSKSLRPKGAAEFFSIGTSTLWRWVKEKPDFPKPIKLGERVTVFDAEELKLWRDAQAGKAVAQ